MGDTGYDVLLFVDTANDPQNPTFTKVAGQRGLTLNKSMEEVDVTDKDSDNWKEFVASLREWSIDADGVIETLDGGFAYLQDTYLNRRTVLVQVLAADGSSRAGLSFITDFPEEFPYDDAATFTLTLRGTGPLTTVPAP